MAGYSAIGLVRPKNIENIGGVLRAATCYGASMVALENPRCSDRLKSLKQDTPKTWKNIPVISTDNLKSCVPVGATIIAVDLVEKATSIIDFIHPRSAFYIFGPEDNTLKDHLEWAHHTIYIPTQQCMNLAACVNVVLYDRLAKNTNK